MGFSRLFFFFSSRRRHTRYWRDWSSDVCSSDLIVFIAVFPGFLRNGAPQVVDLLLQVLLALLLAQTLFLGGNRVRAFVAVNAVVHQRMAGVEQVLNRVDAVAFLALHDVLLGEH